MFTIEYAAGVEADLADLRAFDRRRILDRVEEQLVHQPTQESRNKKMLPGLVPPFEHEPPVWELRVGEYRIYYDVDETALRVTIRALRRKPPHKTTEEIL
jgi:mRNA-degrading endonuclease RelE of RelBE toxin-antitoxin system